MRTGSAQVAAIPVAEIHRGAHEHYRTWDTQSSAEQALQQGDADMVAFGRLFIANPDLPERFAQGASLNEPDPETFYGGSEAGYTDYPALAQVKKRA